MNAVEGPAHAGPLRLAVFIVFMVMGVGGAHGAGPDGGTLTSRLVVESLLDERGNRGLARITGRGEDLVWHGRSGHVGSAAGRTEARLSTRERELAYLDRRERGARLFGDARRAALSVETGYGAAGAFQATLSGVRTSSGVARGGRLGVSLRNRRGSEIRAAAFSSPLPWRLVASDGTAGYLFPLDLRTRGIAADLEARLAGNFLLSTRLAGGGVSASSGNGTADAFFIRPDAGWRDFRVSFDRRGARGLVGVSAMRASLGGRANARHHDLRFARIFAFDAEFTRIGIRTEVNRGRHAASLGVDRMALDASARGDVQSWPFTPAVVDLLGARLFFESDAKVAVTRVHAGDVFRRGVGARWFDAASGGVDYVDLAIDARGASWNPKYLIFERTNEQRGRLTLRRLRGLVLSGGIEGHCGRLGLSGLAIQIVPLSVHRARSAPASPGGESTAPAGTLNPDRRGGPASGRVVTMSARWRWR